MKIPSSKIGWAFAGSYSLIALVMFLDVADCTGMFCDFDAFPVVVPFGIVCIYAVKALDTVYFFGTSYTSYSWGDPAFVIPTMIGNAFCYYWFGVFVGWSVKKILPKKRENI